MFGFAASGRFAFEPAAKMPRRSQALIRVAPVKRGAHAVGPRSRSSCPFLAVVAVPFLAVVAVPFLAVAAVHSSRSVASFFPDSGRPLGRTPVIATCARLAQMFVY